jgi:hypothetical protein
MNSVVTWLIVWIKINLLLVYVSHIRMSIIIYLLFLRLLFLLLGINEWTRQPLPQTLWGTLYVERNDADQKYWMRYQNISRKRKSTNRLTKYGSKFNVLSSRYLTVSTWLKIADVSEELALTFVRAEVTEEYCYKGLQTITYCDWSAGNIIVASNEHRALVRPQVTFLQLARVLTWSPIQALTTKNSTANRTYFILFLYFPAILLHCLTASMI